MVVIMDCWKLCGNKNMVPGMYMSYGSAPCALSTRDPVYHILEPPNFQELSWLLVNTSSQPKKRKVAKTWCLEYLLLAVKSLASCRKANKKVMV